MCLNIMENSGGSNWTERGTYIYIYDISYRTVRYPVLYHHSAYSLQLYPL